ncbi:HAD-IA family hydrolase [soil metagenome]
MVDKPLFGAQSFAAFLFDMDGTLISSIEAAERVWTQWARRHCLDVATFLPTIHGVRAVDTVRRQALPGVDAEMEAETIALAEMEDVGGVRPISGAPSFLSLLPADRWAIVTSAPRALALRRMEAAGVAPPPVLVTAEDVVNGKPHPDGFLLAANMLGFAAKDCLVFEDAPAGIAAAEGAGASVLVIRETHVHPLATGHISVDDYTGLTVATDPSGALHLLGK